ncbi:MAG: 16S rRNA (cytosine(1402)-N(4))-methyltransferase RsmH [Candidatus Omnitrophica bacterium]|nr:16S rRNA (cytosine(1402)-N(4))-methyltransferase RsmH [Candidatus Omnitrophota bacterium]
MNSVPDGTGKPQRRARYKGSHPRHFSEKYKEHASEKYPEEVQKVVAAGKTPAGTHRPICVPEILSILDPRPGQVGLDATLGFGGHTAELLKKVLPGGRIYALDVDPDELARTEQRLRGRGYSDNELIVRHSNFAGSAKLLNEEPAGFDFILADLGVSSMQLDDPRRGFTYKWEGPLDLRMNPRRGPSAAELIRSLDAVRLQRIFEEYADEPGAAVLARAVDKNKARIHTTLDLAELIARTLENKSAAQCSQQTRTSIRRVFQALRIAVNEEFTALEQFLRRLPLCLKPGGRAAVLSFHSGEDRRVMEFFRQGAEEGIYAEVSEDPIRPGAEERYANPRSKSALLRWAVKAGA